jgi:hypothetical protein
VTTVEYDPASGALSAPAPLIAALLREPDAPPADLEPSGAVVGSRLAGGLARAVAAVAASRCELRLERGPRIARGWVAADRATFVAPLPDGRARLRNVPPEFVPEALARLNDLGPRPRAQADAPLAFSPADLAQRIATWPGLREHWRVAAAWPPGGSRAVEVVDTDGGLWLVAPGTERVELQPVSPSDVFLLLCALLPDDGELADAAD